MLRILRYKKRRGSTFVLGFSIPLTAFVCASREQLTCNLSNVCEEVQLAILAEGSGENGNRTLCSECITAKTALRESGRHRLRFAVRFAMHKRIRVTLFVGPFLVLPAIGWLYTYLNIHRRIFVTRLGCGCTSGFNTNFLTAAVFCALIGAAAISWWFAARELGMMWRWALLLTFAITNALAFHYFFYYNFWL